MKILKFLCVGMYLLIFESVILSFAFCAALQYNSDSDSI